MGERKQLEPRHKKKTPDEQQEGQESSRGGGGGVEEGKEFERLDGWKKCGAGTVGSDQIRSRNAIQSTSDSLGAWVQGCMDGYAVTWHNTSQKVSRADRSSLRQADRCRARLLAPPSLGRLVRHRSVHSAGSKPQILPPGTPSSGLLALSRSGTTPVRLSWGSPHCAPH